MSSTHDFLNDDNIGRGRSRRKQNSDFPKSLAVFTALVIAAVAVLSVFLLFKYRDGASFDYAEGGQEDNNSISAIDGGQSSTDAGLNAGNTGITGNSGTADGSDSSADGISPLESDNSQSAASGAGDTQAETGKFTELLSDPVRMTEENCYPLDDGGDGVITIRFAGDLLLDDSYAIAASIRKRSGGALIGEGGFDNAILKLMRDADIFMINNEFTYTSRGTPTEGKQFTFRAKPENVSFLNDIGADIVTLANNHAYDYGEISLLDSMDALKGAGIIYAGAGHDLAEASSPVYYVDDDIKIAIIASTQMERMPNPDTKGATPDAPGVFRSMNLDALTDAIKKAKEVSDFVIVYTHWGTEGQSEIDWSQREQAPIIAEAGADLIIGSHPHVLQKIEWQKDTPVFYSLGNYLFNSKTLDTCLAEVNIDASDGSILNLRFIPALQSGCRTFLPEGDDFEAALERMRDLSPDVVIDDEGYISQAIP